MKITMKKIVSVLLAGVMAVSVSATAFAAEKTAYTYTQDKIQITVGTEAKSVLTALGKANSEKVLTNCANGGKDKAYIYDNIEVHTTQNQKKVTVIDQIVLTSDKVQTEEGLKIGQKPADVKKLYPTAKENLGLYTVQLGETCLVIDCGMKNDKVVSIAYEYVEAK